LGCRIAGNIKETLKGETVTNIGYGDLFGAITITLFYAVILVIWKERFQEEEKGYGLLGWILFLMVPVRFALMVPPQNDWGTLTPSQPWTSIRNIPLIIQGLSVALLILRDSCPVKDRVYQWFGILIVISYACVIPVVFAGQKYEQLGLLMIPKSIAYVAMALLAYYRYFSRTKAIDIHNAPRTCKDPTGRILTSKSEFVRAAIASLRRFTTPIRLRLVCFSMDASQQLQLGNAST
jgi:hypothetical protein